MTDTGNGLSLPIGEGGRGLGVTRDTGTGADAVVERVPRNAPPVFNLGAREFTALFYDGRVEVDPSQSSGFRSPAGDDLPQGLENLLAVQAMFPVTSAMEMAGQAGEHTIADAAAVGNLAGPEGVWDQLAQRLREVPEYVDRFIEVFPFMCPKQDAPQDPGSEPDSLGYQHLLCTAPFPRASVEFSETVRETMGCHPLSVP